MGSYYNLATYDPEEERDFDPQGPALSNLCAAAVYVGQLLQSHDLQYAVMGGFAMVCRGSPRTTSDVDVATNASMKQLWSVIEPEAGNVLPRLIIPNTKLLDKIIPIFVQTGPSHGDDFCTDDRLIEVDLSVFGGGSGPSDLKEHIEILNVDLEGRTFHIAVMDLYYMMRTKLRTLTSREAARDFDDIDFLLMHFTQQVERISNRLDVQDRAMFLDSDLVKSKGPSAMKQYQTVLCV